MHSDSNTPDQARIDSAPETSTTNVASSKRPAVAILISVTFTLSTLVAIVIAFVYLVEYMVGMERQPSPEQDTTFLLALAITSAGMAFSYLIITIGLFRLRSWAWSAGMVLLGINLALGLANYLHDNQTLPSLFIPVISVFLLNQHGVRNAFNVNQEQHDSSIKTLQRASHTE